MTQAVEHHKKRCWLLGLAAGILNGLFGAGGGMATVPMLRTMGLSAEETHATSIAIILPLAIASGFFYLQAEQFSLSDAWVYLPGGLAGALFGAWLLPRFHSIWLRRIFGAVVVFSACRLLMR